MPPLPLRLLLCGAAAAVLTSACATRLQVQSVPTADGTPMHELRGHTLAALQRQAEVLCPRGHRVLRQWSHSAPRDPEAGFLGKAWGWASDAIGPGEEDRAQLLVQCS